MTPPIFTLDCQDLATVAGEQQQQALAALESGHVVYCPNYYFSQGKTLNPQLLSETILDGKHKNISFDARQAKLGGFDRNNQQLPAILTPFMQAFVTFAQQAVVNLFPDYQSALRLGRTSYRPAEIKGRVQSRRKDDTRLHVDAFAASPVYGQRILRVFCNINPHNQARVWHLGEPFAQVLQRFAPRIKPYNLNKARLLHWIRATKSLRSAYDHYQLQLHDQMKLDDNYQQQVIKHRVDFPAYSTWFVFTDQASHAALGGQYLLEQTFYLPVEAMANPGLSPLKQWQQLKNMAKLT